MLRQLASAVFVCWLLGLSGSAAGVPAGAGGTGATDAYAEVGGAAPVTLATPAPRVVVLASYHQGDAWTDRVVAGLLADLQGADPALVPALEYLDTKRFPDPEHLTLLRETLARKYRDRPVDLVIALDNPALDLLRAHPRDLFPEVPVVFAGINGFRPELLRERPATTGVAEVEDIAGTLDLALRLHPGTRRVLVVHDDTASGRAVRRDMEAILPGLGERVAVDFAPEVPFADLERQLAALPPDSLVLVLTYVTDAAGRVFSRDEGTRLISAASPVPVYAMHGTRLGHGIVGGLLLDGREHGAQAGALARRVLAGEDPARIPVEPSRSYPEFDDRQLRRFRIAETALPPDSRIIHRPESFYRQYRDLVRGALLLFGVLSLAVVLLSLAVLRARRAEAATHAGEERYRTLFETMAQGVVYQDPAGLIIRANPAALRILGLTLEQLQGRTSIDPRWHTIHEDGSPFPGDQHPAMTALRTGREVPGTLMGVFNPAREAVRWLIVHAVPQFQPGAPRPFQVIATFDDITDLRAAEAALRRAEERLDLAVQGADLGLYDADLCTGAVRVNESYERIMGYAPGEFQATVQGWWENMHPADRPRVERLTAQSRRPGGVFEAEYRVRHRDGRWVWVLDRGRGFDRDAQGLPRRGAGTRLDITARKESEERITRLSRLYQTLSDTNQAIVRTTDEAELFRQVCDIALRLTGFALVWIGLADRGQNRVLPVAAAGAAAPSLRAQQITLDPPPPPGTTLAAAVLADGQALVRNDWGAEPGPGGDGDGRGLDGLGAVACLPLHRGGQPVGVLEVGAATPGYFDAEVMTLLQEMAQDLSYAMDNLERTRALAESQAQYRRMVETASEGICSVDAGNRITFANRRMAEMLGYAPEDLLRQPVKSFLFPEDLAAHEAQMQGRMRGESAQYERRFRRRDGSTLWTIVAGAPVMDAAGQFSGSFGMFTDITEERAARHALEQYRAGLEETVAARTAALAATEEELRLILASSASGLCGLHPDGTISFANPAACHLLGHPAERLVGAGFHALVHRARTDGSPYPAAECPMETTLREGRPVTVDNEVFWCADGQAVPVIYSAHPMLRNGAIVGAVVSFLDLSERRRLEERLRRLAVAVEAIAGVRDLAGLAAIVCAAARRLTGADGATLVLRDGESCEYVGEDAVGPLWQGRRFPLDASAAGWVIRHAAPLNLTDISGDQRVPPDLYQGTFVRGLCVVPIGRTQPLGAIGCYWSQPQDSDDGAVDLAQALADAAAVGLANLDLIGRLTEARAVAERLAQVKSLFLANMSHEIRTPMNAILGLAHLLQRGTRDPDQQDKLTKISSAANHLLTILNDILDFSKIEAGKLELEERGFDLATVLERACGLVADAARAKGLALQLHLDPALRAAPWRCGDPTRLTQLLLNYLVNAVKFTERGDVTLTVGPDPADPDGGLLRFCVRDTGIGIDPADQGRLFDAFEQLDASTTRRHGGTGLGLAINRRLAELMGGSTGVLSLPGAGSTFWFTARLGRGPEAADALGPAPAQAQAEADDTDAAELALRREHHGRRILLAEDNPINQEVALELLRGAGLLADLAADGAQAVALARAQRYDLILMDMQMPVLDGLEATMAIRALPGYAATPILALTANAFGEDRARCLSAGMDDHVGKPVEPAVLFAALLRWLPGGAAVPAPGADDGTQAPLGADGEHAAATGTALVGKAVADGEVLDRLAAIPGLDTALALRHLGGRADRLGRLLRVFADHNSEAPARLRERLAAGDSAEAQRLAHGLKGAAATLGATAVQTRARELEQALHDGGPPAELEPRIDRLEETLADLLTALDALRGGAPGP